MLCSAKATSIRRLKEFEAAVAANPNDAFLHFRLASLYLRKGDLKKALVEAETAAQAGAQERGPPSASGRALFLAWAKTKKALRNMTKFCKLDPKNQEALLYLGALYLAGR